MDVSNFSFPASFMLLKKDLVVLLPVQKKLQSIISNLIYGNNKQIFYCK